MSAFLTTIACLVCSATFVAGAYAQSPREQFAQMVEQLQKSPGDASLREKIMKMAMELKPPPVVPAEVDELVGRAAYISKNAKGETEFAEAARAYERALLLAPWVADYYLRLADAQEKAGRFKEAVASLRWYLVAAPQAQDARAVRERIGGLTYAAEGAAKTAAAKAEEERKQLGIQILVRNTKAAVQGKRYVHYDCRHSRDPTSVFQGCNVSEYSASNWYRNSLVRQTYEFDFLDDGTALLKVVEYPNLVYVVGVPDPSGAGYKWHISNPGHWRTQRTPAWAELSGDGTAIVVSENRPVTGPFDVHRRYRYIMYSAR